MCSYDDVKGMIGVVLVLLANVFMIMRCVRLYQQMDVGAARKVMFGSYLYLPVILLALLLSKIPGELKEELGFIVENIQSFFV